MSIPDLSLVLDFASEGLRGARQDLADLRSRGAEEDDRIRSLERALGSNVTDAVGDQSSIRSQSTRAQTPCRPRTKKLGISLAFSEKQIRMSLPSY